MDTIYLRCVLCSFSLLLYNYIIGCASCQEQDVVSLRHPKSLTDHQSCVIIKREEKKKKKKRNAAPMPGPYSYAAPDAAPIPRP
jgi:hypothetical protein